MHVLRLLRQHPGVLRRLLRPVWAARRKSSALESSFEIEPPAGCATVGWKLAGGSLPISRQGVVLIDSKHAPLGTSAARAEPAALAAFAADG